MKYIREGRFGRPKTWKTGSVVSTYPKPMLVFEFEPGGLEIIKTPIVFMTLLGFDTNIKNPSFKWPDITALDFAFRPQEGFNTNYVPAKDKETFDNVAKAINLLVATKPQPFKTVVIDTVTALSQSIWSHQAVTNSAALADARKWAGNIGEKVGQIIDFLTMPTLQVNVVFIFHTEVIKDEDTKQINEFPMVHSRIRNYVAAKFSQFMYQTIDAGKPIVRVKPFDFVTGIGCRWPEFTNEKYPPTFEALYGQEKDVLR